MAYLPVPLSAWKSQLAISYYIKWNDRDNVRESKVLILLRCRNDNVYNYTTASVFIRNRLSTQRLKTVIFVTLKCGDENENHKKKILLSIRTQMAATSMDLFIGHKLIVSSRRKFVGINYLFSIRSYVTCITAKSMRRLLH